MPDGAAPYPGAFPTLRAYSRLEHFVHEILCGVGRARLVSALLYLRKALRADGQGLLDTGGESVAAIHLRRQAPVGRETCGPEHRGLAGRHVQEQNAFMSRGRRAGASVRKGG